MTDIVKVHRQALDATRAVVSGISDTQWSRPTPCDGWDVRTLLNHIVAGTLWAVELGTGRTIDEVGDRLDGDTLGSDPLAAYDHSARDAAEVFASPGALDAPCAVSYGPVPGSVYAGHRFVDVLIHGWDLAVATGQDPTLDPDLCEAALAVIQKYPPSFWGAGRFFAPRVETTSTDPQIRLLSFSGRDPTRRVTH
jgi:uncharacterized protein (TIGR03086 family)